LSLCPQLYLASGWFNPSQKAQMEEAYEVLSGFRDQGAIRLFAPFYDGIVLSGSTPSERRRRMQEVWELDIGKLSKSALVIVLTQDHDVGTIFESGYASALKIPLLCYNSVPELGLNVMLSQEARGFCKTPEELAKAVAGFLEAKNRLEWRYNLWKGEPF